MSAQIEYLNRELIDKYGRDINNSMPTYRIVWSNSQTEMRYGTFEDYLGDVFLREVTEVRECLKYPAWEDCWVFEVLQPNTTNPELKANYSYEPLHVFGANGSDRQPNWKACELIVKHHKFIQRVKVLPSDLAAAEVERMEREKKLFKDMLDDASPYLAGMLKDGHAVAVPSNYEKQDNKE